MLAARQRCDTPVIRVERYAARPARYFPYDPEAPQVAARVIDAILDCRSTLYVDHIGSTAVPGCGGKGIIDLFVSYPAGAFFVARDALDQVGFQPQGGPEPFPESRPMRVGAATYRGKAYLIHAHVIRSGDREGQDLIRFRDRLRADAELVQAYQVEKLSILASGITVSSEYSKAKSEFIRGVLGAAHGTKPVASARTGSIACSPASQIVTAR
ncbi:MAG: GrpB family protein [Candidatus Binatia bacterium]